MADVLQQLLVERGPTSSSGHFPPPNQLTFSKCALTCFSRPTRVFFLSWSSWWKPHSISGHPASFFAADTLHFSRLFCRNRPGHSILGFRLLCKTCLRKTFFEESSTGIFSSLASISLFSPGFRFPFALECRGKLRSVRTSQSRGFAISTSSWAPPTSRHPRSKLPGCRGLSNGTRG